MKKLKHRYCKFYERKNEKCYLIKIKHPQNKHISVPFNLCTYEDALEIYLLCCKLIDIQINSPEDSYLNHHDLIKDVEKIQRKQHLKKVIERMTNAGLLKHKNEISVEQVLESYYQSLYHTKTTTYKNHLATKRFWLSVLDGKSNASHVMPSDIINITDGLRTDLKKRTIRRKILWIQKAYRFYKFRNPDLQNNIESIDLDLLDLSEPRTKEEDVYFTGEESPYPEDIIDQIFKSLEESWEVKFAFGLCLHTGRRHRELYELTWGSFFEEDGITYMNCLVKPKSKPTYMGKFPLTKEAADLFQEFKMHYLAEGKVLKKDSSIWDTFYTRKDVGSWENGHRDTFHRLTTRNMKRISEPFWTARHTFEKDAAYGYLNGGKEWDLKTLADYVGSSPATIMKYYLNNQKVKERARNENLLENHSEVFRKESRSA